MKLSGILKSLIKGTLDGNTYARIEYKTKTSQGLGFSSYAFRVDNTVEELEPLLNKRIVCEYSYHYDRNKRNPTCIFKDTMREARPEEIDSSNSVEITGRVTNIRTFGAQKPASGQWVDFLLHEGNCTHKCLAFFADTKN